MTRYEIPPERRDRLNASTLRLTLEPALMERYEGVEVIAAGSLVLDKILEDATSRGHHCVARVETGGAPPVEETVAANIAVKGARYEIVSTERDDVLYFLFVFRVTLVTDEKTELLEKVLVNSKSLVDHRVRDLFLEESLTLPEGKLDQKGDLAGSYDAACGILEQRILDVVAEVNGNAKRRQEEEEGRINGYFDGLVREAMETKMPHQLGSALKALDVEREKRLDETRTKYGLEARVRLASVRTILVPTTFVTIRLIGRKTSRELSLEYDEIGLELSLQRCEGCGRETLEISLCDYGHIVCNGCGRVCALCSNISCTACEVAGKALHRCVECSRTLCDEHVIKDDFGRGEYCPSHILDCPSCSKKASRAFVTRCGNCNQKYCFLCVGKRQKYCTTCKSLRAIGHGDEDVKTAVKRSVTGAKYSKWRKAKNRRYTIVEGKTLLSRKTFVLDNKGNLVWEG